MLKPNNKEATTNTYAYGPKFGCNRKICIIYANINILFVSSRKKLLFGFKSWALILVFIKVHVKDVKYSIRSVWYEYDEKYEMHLFNDCLVKIFKCFCRRVTTSSEIFKDFNNGFERKCRYLEIRIHGKTSINHYLKTN